VVPTVCPAAMLTSSCCPRTLNTCCRVVTWPLARWPFAYSTKGEGGTQYVGIWAEQGYI
jgi:hypothetical protein